MEQVTPKISNFNTSLPHYTAHNILYCYYYCYCDYYNYYYATSTTP